MVTKSSNNGNETLYQKAQRISLELQSYVHMYEKTKSKKLDKISDHSSETAVKLTRSCPTRCFLLSLASSKLCMYTITSTSHDKSYSYDKQDCNDSFLIGHRNSPKVLARVHLFCFAMIAFFFQFESNNESNKKFSRIGYKSHSNYLTLYAIRPGSRISTSSSS